MGAHAGVGRPIKIASQIVRCHPLHDYGVLLHACVWWVRSSTRCWSWLAVVISLHPDGPPLQPCPDTHWTLVMHGLLGDNTCRRCDVLSGRKGGERESGRDRETDWKEKTGQRERKTWRMMGAVVGTIQLPITKVTERAWLSTHPSILGGTSMARRRPLSRGSHLP